ATRAGPSVMEVRGGTGAGPGGSSGVSPQALIKEANTSQPIFIPPPDARRTPDQVIETTWLFEATPGRARPGRLCHWSLAVQLPRNRAGRLPMAVALEEIHMRASIVSLTFLAACSGGTAATGGNGIDGGVPDAGRQPPDASTIDRLPIQQFPDAGSS